MKIILSLSLLLMFKGWVHAQDESKIYCRDLMGSIHDAITPEGHQACLDPFWAGLVCFTGKANQAVWLINQGTFDWNEQWVARASIINEDEISYLCIDGPNEYQTRLTMFRCYF